MSQVVNVKVVFIRPQYNNLIEWVNNENNYYIGRRGIVFIDGKRFPERDSPFANPYKIGTDGNREDVLKKSEISCYFGRSRIDQNHLGNMKYILGSKYMIKF